MAIDLSTGEEAGEDVVAGEDIVTVGILLDGREDQWKGGGQLGSRRQAGGTILRDGPTRKNIRR